VLLWGASIFRNSLEVGEEMAARSRHISFHYMTPFGRHVPRPRTAACSRARLLPRVPPWSRRFAITAAARSTTICPNLTDQISFDGLRVASRCSSSSGLLHRRTGGP